jgi:hypothetical protein
VEILRPRARDRGQDLDGLLLRHEDAELAREPRHRGESATDADGEAFAALVDHADKRHAVDLGRVAAIRAGGDRVLVLPRQVAEVRVAVEERRRLVDDPRAVEELVRVEALHGATGDVANGVAAASRSRDPGGVEMREDLGQRSELEPVQLDVLSRRELAVTAAVPLGHLPDRAQLRRSQVPARELHAEHEGPDLRLVVVEPPPLQADDVLLRDLLVAGGDERGELVADLKRRLLALDPLDRVALEHELPVGLGLRGARVPGFDCHWPAFACERWTES